MSGPPFTMSKYLTHQELLEDKCKYYEARSAELEQALEEAKDRIKDLLLKDDGQAYKEAEKFLDLLTKEAQEQGIYDGKGEMR